MEVAGTCAST